MGSNIEHLLITIIVCQLIFMKVQPFKRRMSISEQNFETSIKNMNPSELRQRGENGNTLLHQAAEKGYASSVELLCRLNLDINDKNDQHKTPLHLAASNGNTGIIDILVQNGAEVDCHDDVERTPLYLASIEGHLDVIKTLVIHGADLETTRNNDATGLYQASFGGHLGVVEYFVNMSPGLLHKTKDTGATAFYVAAFGQQVEVMSFLVSKGANIDQQKSNGETALTMASKKGFNDVVTFLLNQGADKNLAKHNGVTALFSASEYGRTEVVESLLSYNADVNKATSAGESPLYVACSNGHGEIAKMLLKHQANPNMAGQNDFLPLHVSVESGDLETVIELIKSQASVNVRSMNGLTPIMIASAGGFLDIVKTLVECETLGCPMKPNLDAVNSEEETALYLATVENHIEVMEYLLRKGARITVGKGKLNAFFSAIEHNSTETVKIFFDTVHEDLCSMVDQHHNTGLHIAIGHSMNAIFIELIERGCYNDLAGEFSRTPLCLAAMHGNSLQVKILLKNGANPNYQTLSGETPLYIATQGGHITVVEQLLKAGALPNLATHTDHTTPLFEAAMQGYTDIVERLVNAGADVNATTATDRASILCVATLFDHEEVVKLLLEHNANVNHIDADGENAAFMLAQKNFDGITKNSYSTNQVRILEMLISGGINITQKRNDQLNAYTVAQRINSKVIAKELFATGHFKEDDTLTIPDNSDTNSEEQKRFESEWDIGSSIDWTLLLIFVVVVASLPYLAFKISCLLDDKETSPFIPVKSLKKRGGKCTDGNTIQRKNMQVDNKTGEHEDKNIAAASTDDKTVKQSLTEDVSNGTDQTNNMGTLPKKVDHGNTHSGHRENEITEEQVVSLAAENLETGTDRSLDLAKNVPGMIGINGEFQMQNPAPGGSVTVIYNKVMMIGKDSDSRWHAPLSIEEEERFHNGGGNVQLEGFSPYEILCGIRKSHTLFVEYLQCADDIAGLLYQTSDINSKTLKKINDEKYDKNKKLLDTLYSIQASRWVENVMEHLKMNQSSLYDRVIESCAASVEENTSTLGDEPLVEEPE